MDYEKNNSLGYTVLYIFVALLLLTINTYLVGSQAEPLHFGGGRFGIPNTHELNNYIKILLLFPISFYLFIKTVNKINNNYFRAALYFLQSITIAFYAYIFVDRSILFAEDNFTVDGWAYKVSADTFPLVLIIIIVYFIIGVSRLNQNKISTFNKK